MKVSLIAVMSCLVLSVKSHAYMGGVTTPADVSKWHGGATLELYTNKKMPVMDVQSTDLICRSPDMTDKRVPFSVAAGDTIRLTWDMDNDAAIVERKALLGPCSFWLAKLSSKGLGASWTKIHQQTYDADKTTTEWCTNEILRAGSDKKAGTYDLVIPKGIEKGLYLLRSEIIDLTGAAVSNYDDYTMGARYYPNCLVLDITGDGSSPLKNPVDILNEYKKYYKTPLMTGGLDLTKFKYPGPAALDAKSSS
ncbi:hypothetical protein GGF44_002238 [Coemansia sp. RSA 1694]|nr:hypothetical protein GGF44_002238 [Coemansia sp. RSA 1694]